MFSAIVILLLLPITDVSRSRGMQFRPLSKLAFYVFVSNFLILMKLGAKHVESPFIELGQLSTVFYFLYFSVIMYSITLIENTLVDISLVYRYTTSYDTKDTTNNDTAVPYIFTNMALHSNMEILSITPLTMSLFLDVMNLFSDAIFS
jgi:ubiquinol-cytochrome c reductase cytochrome b subunit